jgi:hypothetical protein
LPAPVVERADLDDLPVHVSKAGGDVKPGRLRQGFDAATNIAKIASIVERSV